MTERPQAPPEREEWALEMFPYLQITPEEYAARHAHEWYSFSFDDYHYENPDFDRWVQRLGDIFFRRKGAPTVDELRKQFLTKDEIAEIEVQESEDNF